MFQIQIVVVLCACALVVGDIVHLRALKARLAGKHRKRGVLSGVPPYKLGHDIPLVTHSVVKPVVVTYPPTAAVHNVKVPLNHPLWPRPTPADPHSAPPRGFKLPHHTRTVLLPRPESHFHHHHHHIAPRPLLPVVPAPPVVPATPIVPLPQATVSITRPLPVPAPPLFVEPTPAAPPPLAIHPVHHAHPAPLTPLLPAAAVPAAPHYSYVLRPGNAVQSSFFATYPRYPLLNYHQPLVPFAPPATPPLYVQRPQVPQFHLASASVIPQPVPVLGVQPTPTVLQPAPTGVLSVGHVHGEQPALVEHDGWAPLPATPNPTFESAHGHAVQEQVAHDFAHVQVAAEHEQHAAEEHNYHEYQHQLQNHLQQIEQAQYEQHVNQHHLGQEYGQPDQGYAQHGHDYAQQAQDFTQHVQQAHDFIQNMQQAHDFAQHPQQDHDFAQQAHDFAHQSHDFTQYTEQGHDFGQHAHQAHNFGHNENDFAQHTQEGHNFAQQAHEYEQHAQQAHEYAQQAQQAHEYAQQAHEYAQHAQNFGLGGQHPNAEYGPPQHLEGRSAEGAGDAGNMEEAGDGELRYHNHIPLGLQPPIDRPLDHFR